VGPEGQLALKVAHSNPKKVVKCLDSGSTGFFCGDADPLHEVEDVTTYRPIHMGTTSSHVTRQGKRIERFPSAFDPSVVYCVVLGFQEIKGFQRNLLLFSTNLMWLFRVIDVRPPQGKGAPYMYVDGDDVPMFPLEAIRGKSAAFNLEVKQNGLITLPDSVEPGPGLRYVDLLTGNPLSGGDDTTILRECSFMSRSNANLAEALCVSTASCQSPSMEPLQFSGCSFTSRSNADFAEFALCVSSSRNTAPSPRPLRVSDVAPSMRPLRVCLIGMGKGTELQLQKQGVPIQVAVVIEVGRALDRARSIFPGAQILDDVDKVIKLLRRGSITLAEHDLCVCTYPCTDNTALKELNGYCATATEHLFVESQKQFIKLVQPPRVLNEMTPTRWNYFMQHFQLEADFVELGYDTKVDMFDAACVGDFTSHFRFFLFASRMESAHAFRVLEQSGMRCTPPSLSDILEPVEEVPAQLVCSGKYLPRAGPLVLDLFSSWGSSIKGEPNHLNPDEHAMSAVLLSWAFDKQQLTQACFGVRLSGCSPSLYGMDDPAMRYLFVVFHNRLPSCYQFTVCLDKMHGSDACFQIGFGSVMFHVSGEAVSAKLDAGVVVDLINQASSGLVSLRSTGEIEFVDPRNTLRTVTRATLAHTVGNVDVRQLETTLCMPSGPVATLTSYMRNIVYVSHEDDTVTYRFLTLREMNAIKSFDSESLRYLRTLPFNAACSVIASAIPARMLEAVYRTASACILPEQQPCQALKTVGKV